MDRILDRFIQWAAHNTFLFIAMIVISFNKIITLIDFLLEINLYDGYTNMQVFMHDVVRLLLGIIYGILISLVVIKRRMENL